MIGLLKYRYFDYLNTENKFAFSIQLKNEFFRMNVAKYLFLDESDWKDFEHSSTKCLFLF